MTDIKQILINKARDRFLNGDVAEFSSILKDLYDSHITCNCFLRDQPKALWESLLNKAESLRDSTGDFDLNFAKGFIFWINKSEQEAFKYLTIAIKLNPLSDICYSLRATIDETINHSKLDDAKEAVLLNPNAKNYFRLANTYDDKNLKIALTYYEKATSLDGNFACAYNNMASKYKSLKDYQSAVSAFIKCIEIDKKHWCYYSLWLCLDELSEYEKALQYIQKGHLQHPENLQYYFALGVANARLNQYKEAIGFYNLYLSHFPNSDIAKNNLGIAKTKIANKLLEKAITEYSQNNFTSSHESFNEYLSLCNVLSYENLVFYFKAILKCKDPKIEFDELNLHYIRLRALKDSYLDKTSKHEPITEDEENINKLITYRGHYKIGFGNYDGLTIQEIINIDSHYIIWCIINLFHFSISPSLFLQESLKSESDYLEALEINLAKIELISSWSEEDDDDQDWCSDYDGYDDHRPSYEEYGGAYGYDDDTIDSAFDGDPENYWNID